MGQDKEKLIALLHFIEELYKNPENQVFTERINELVLSNMSDVNGNLERVVSSIYQSISELREGTFAFYSEANKCADKFLTGQEKGLYLNETSYHLMKEIHEMCLMKILREHAAGFYSHFPIVDIKNSLIEDFVKMESCKRHGDFDGFCRHMYLQIEYIVNYLAKEFTLQDIVNNMLDVPAYIVGAKCSERKTDSSYTIRNLIFYKPKESDLKERNQKCAGIPIDLPKLHAMLKFKCIWYFIGLNTCMTNLQYDDWCDYASVISDLYNYRCKESHRGSDVNPNAQATYDKIDPQTDWYTVKFYSYFYRFITQITSGFPISNEIKEFVNTLKSSSSQVPQVDETIIDEYDFIISNQPLPSCCFISYNGKSVQLPTKLFSKYKSQLEKGTKGKVKIKGKDVIDIEISND